MKDNARTILSAFGVACLLFAIAAILMSLPFAARQYAVLKHWPETKAQVLSSNVVQRGGDNYSVQLELMLQVAGHPQVVTTEMPQPGSDAEKAQKAADRFRQGSWIIIRYNPADISEIRLDPDHPARFFRLPILLGSMALLFGVIAIVFFWSARRASTN